MSFLEENTVLNKRSIMNEKEFCVALIKCITAVLLEHTSSESEALKIITIGVQSALLCQKREK